MAILDKYKARKAYKKEIRRIAKQAKEAGEYLTTGEVKKASNYPIGSSIFITVSKNRKLEAIVLKHLTPTKLSLRVMMNG